jgi:hypothetical protein
MNLLEQIGALEASVDRLNERNRHAETAAAAAVEQAEAARAEAAAAMAAAEAAAAVAAAKAESPTPIPETEPEPAAPPTLRVARPSHNEITLTIGKASVTLRPEQIGQLIEELANARASMTPEPPAALPAGWRFASTKNPVMAVQKQPNGDRLLVARHLGHGWVPFTFSPEAAIQLYMMLTQR